MAKSKKAAVAANAEVTLNHAEMITDLPVVVGQDAMLADLLDEIGADESGIESIDMGDALDAGLDLALSDEVVEAAAPVDAAVEEVAAVEEIAAVAADEPVAVTEPVAAAPAVDATDSLDADLDALLAAPAPLAADALETALEAIVEGAEKTEAKQAIYAEQEGQPAPSDAEVPSTDAAALTDAAPAKPKKPKAAPRPTSVTHKPGDLLKLKLGAKANEFLVLSMADAALPPDELQVKIDAFVARMNDNDAIADKVRDKISMLFVWLTKGGELNEVMKRAFTVLHRDGVLTSGDKGNLQQNLLAKPYSVGTARSQANQMFMMFPELQLAVKGKSSMSPNPDSALLPIINTMLGLA